LNKLREKKREQAKKQGVLASVEKRSTTSTG
jgi:hypothetical protein